MGSVIFLGIKVKPLIFWELDQLPAINPNPEFWGDLSFRNNRKLVDMHLP